MASTPARLGRQELTLSTTPVALTIPDDSSVAYIQTEDENIRVTWDGTTPTATLGISVTSTNSPLIINDRSALENLQMVREGATDAEVNIGYL